MSKNTLVDLWFLGKHNRLTTSELMAGLGKSQFCSGTGGQSEFLMPKI